MHTFYMHYIQIWWTGNPCNNNNNNEYVPLSHKSYSNYQTLLYFGWEFILSRDRCLPSNLVTKTMDGTQFTLGNCHWVRWPILVHHYVSNYSLLFSQNGPPWTVWNCIAFIWCFPYLNEQDVATSALIGRSNGHHLWFCLPYTTSLTDFNDKWGIRDPAYWACCMSFVRGSC